MFAPIKANTCRQKQRPHLCTGQHQFKITAFLTIDHNGGNARFPHLLGSGYFCRHAAGAYG